MMKGKLKYILISLIIVFDIVFIIVSTIFYFKSHPTHWRFNDDFIIGNTYENIIDRYGEPDENYINVGFISYCVGYGYSIILVEPEYYNVFFENGIATHVDMTYGTFPFG